MESNNSFLSIVELERALIESGWTIRRIDENIIYIAGKIIEDERDQFKEPFFLAIEIPLRDSQKGIRRLDGAFIVSPKSELQFASHIDSKKNKGYYSRNNHHLWKGLTCQKLKDQNYSENALCISNLNDKKLIRVMNNMKSNGEDYKLAKLFIMLMDSYIKQFLNFRKTSKWESELKNKQTLSNKDISKMLKTLEVKISYEK